MITTVKIQGDGYLVNGNMSVPKAEGNRHYQDVLGWIAQGNTPEPEFTQEELDQQISLNEINAELNQLQGAVKDSILIQVEQIEWMLANTAMTSTDFSPKIRQKFLDLKIIADKVKARL